jgi:hypothetical protein
MSHSPSHGRVFPSLEEFLNWDSHPPSLIATITSFLSGGEDCTQARVKDGRYKEGGGLVNSLSKSLPVNASRAKNITSGSEVS